MWTQAEALEVCKAVEPIVACCNVHVGLTGGTLYKDGERKDLDLLFYRVRQTPAIDVGTLFTYLEAMGFTIFAPPVLKWCVKARYLGRSVDLLFPEADSGEHTSGG